MEVGQHSSILRREPLKPMETDAAASALSEGPQESDESELREFHGDVEADEAAEGSDGGSEWACNCDYADNGCMAQRRRSECTEVVCVHRRRGKCPDKIPPYSPEAPTG